MSERALRVAPPVELASCPERDEYAPPNQGRAKALGRVRSDLPGALVAFNTAIDQANISNYELARSWGINEKHVRLVRAGKAPLSGDRIDKSPAKVRAAFARAILEGAQNEGATTTVPPERGALRVAVAAGDLARAVQVATADGELSDADRKTIAGAAGRVVDAADAITRSLRKER